jgi:hypothetical protein
MRQLPLIAQWPFKSPPLHSFTMRPINAGSHPLMNPLHKPTDGKRMIVILTPELRRLAAGRCQGKLGFLAVKGD